MASPKAGDIKAPQHPAAPVATAPARTVRLCVPLDGDLARRVRAWAAWHDHDVHALVRVHLESLVMDFEVTQGG